MAVLCRYAMTEAPSIQGLADGCLQFLNNDQPEYVLQVWEEFEGIIKEHPLWLPRFHSWCCQAHLTLKQSKPALRHCHAGRRAAKSIDDKKGVEVFDGLKQQATQLLVSQSSKDLEEGILEQATLAIRQEKWEEAFTLIQISLQEAVEKNDHKMEILSLLTLARIPIHQSTAVQQAFDRAQSIGDFNLIHIVKKSIESLGLEVPVHIF